MKYVIMIYGVSLILFCTPAVADVFDVTALEGISPRGIGITSNIVGPIEGLDRRLVRRLNRMSRHFGETVHLTPNGGCRVHGNRYAPDSKHKISNGCLAADVTMRGVSGDTILRYWRDNGGGGRGRYRNRRFVHVDVWKTRAWSKGWGRHNSRRYSI